MTKILTTLPVSADELQRFREDALSRMIDDAATVLEEKNFVALCDEFTARFQADEWILMGNKDVYYNNDIAGLLPNLAKRDCDYCSGYYPYKTDFLNNLTFEGFKGALPSYHEAKKCFVDKTKYFRDGSYIKVCGSNRCGLTYKDKGVYEYWNTYQGGWKRHGEGWNNTVWTIPIFRFNGVDSSPPKAAAAIGYWLKYNLTPKDFKSTDTRATFTTLKNHKDYLKFDGDKISFDRKKIFDAVLAGTTFAFLPKAQKLLAATKVESSDAFIARIKSDLLNGDKIRADLDPYDENLLTDPNRGHWDLWDFGAGEETAGEVTVPDGLTARDPADDINHGIVAIDFGTKSTVVVYENDRLQILPLQVGSGQFSQGVKASNYENPTVIQFIDVESFVAAYNARAGRPHTKWDHVTVSHTAFDNLTNSDSKRYYSFLTGLKQWCGDSKKRLKLKDGLGVAKDLPPFNDLGEDEMNPLEYYAYYLGLYINNMLQEKRIFLKYIMSFPVSYDKAIRERMRRAFDRGIRKSLPTALLDNEAVMKGFTVQNGASEPAAYAITALQEYAFDPEGDDENYYAVFDFGGGTTDFDFGVLRESDIDRYDYSLIHFGENGDRTLGGENLLKLLAFEVFKANQAKLLNPNPEDKSVGKIQFTTDADGRTFVGNEVLIKDSQEANQNMYNLMEKLRPVWEAPDGDDAQKILSSGEVVVNLFPDKGDMQSDIKLVIDSEEPSVHVDLQKILRDRIEQGIRNFFIAMKEAFDEIGGDEELNIKPLSEVKEISIFLAGNSAKSKIVAELFAEYLGHGLPADETIDEFPFEDGYTLKELNDSTTLCKTEGGELKYIGSIDAPENREAVMAAVEKWKTFSADGKSKAAEIFKLNAEQMPTFKIYPALGTQAAYELQKSRGVDVDPANLAAPTGKTGVAFGLLKCRDSGNVQITHVTPDKNKTPFQFYIGRNKKRKFKTVIDRTTKLNEWYYFIDAGNNFDILYSDLPEAAENTMDVQKARRINVTLDKHDADLQVFIRAVKSNVIEYQVAADIDDLDHPEKLGNVEPVAIELR